MTLGRLTLPALFGLLFVAVDASVLSADAFDEVNEWRRRVGLPVFIEDLAMTRFAYMKARYRAERGLKDSHAGPKPTDGSWREGCGEATPDWGWLTCVMEESATHAGAGMCIGTDGERYMVLYVRGGTGQALIPRQNIPIHNTSYLTPDPPRVGQHRSSPPPQRVCPQCGRIH